MRNNYRQRLLAALVTMMVVMVLGCATEDKSPKGTVLRFISAARMRDTASIDKSLSYERLMIEKTGEAYLNMSTGQANRQASELRSMLLNSIGSGPLSKLGTIAVRIKSEKIKGDRAEVIVYDDKNSYEVYGFSLALENGSWKIYKIAHL